MIIGIIGIGNIGSAIVKGLSDKRESASLFVYDKNEEKNQKISNLPRIKVLRNCTGVLGAAGVIILCVRTDQVSDWVKSYKEKLKDKTLILVQSGISFNNLSQWGLSSTTNVYRVITNINVAENLGHSIALHNDFEGLNDVVSIFEQLGTVFIVKSEAELDQISLITGCTPAITAMFIEGLRKGHDESGNLLYDVVINSLTSMKKNGLSPAEFAQKTYSKGGAFEKCVAGVSADSEFQNILANWLNPLKSSLE